MRQDGCPVIILKLGKLFDKDDCLKQNFYCLSPQTSPKAIFVAIMALNAGVFYAQYHGHPTAMLQMLVEGLRKEHDSLIYLVGDSSLDNKHWFFDTSRSKHTQLQDPSFTADAVNGYEALLEPPRMVKDIAYWLNIACQEHKLSAAAINCAIEESTVRARQPGWFSPATLLEQDQVAATTISAQDYLVVSVGGNDVALSPTLGTVASMLTLSRAMPDSWIKSGHALGMGHFVRLFKKQVKTYILTLLGDTRPKAVLVCMIYYPCTKGDSWADRTLKALGYDSNPAKLQLIIRTIFEFASKDLTIDGTKVIPVPLFEVLDPNDQTDYVQRVEPSVQGGKKMADTFLQLILDAEVATPT
eukprot:m.144900 g.144900  ORF g.144900 m.144900 type:complete len:357 (+) comp16209_c0_seq10:81-1151(+)